MNSLKPNNVKILNSGKISFETPVNAAYLWNNLIIEKRTAVGFIKRFYQDSILHDLWMVFSSPITR
jgi:hypothetical protein